MAENLVANLPSSVDEEWRPVIGHPSYEVSDRGNVRSINRTLSTGRPVKGVYLKPKTNADGYLIVALALGEARRYRHVAIQILVLEAFRGPKPTPKHESAHWDGVEANNMLSNLRWATHAENCADKKRHGTESAPKGSDHWNRRLTESMVREGRELRSNQGVSVTALARRYGVSVPTMSDALSKKTWAHIP